MKNIVSFALFAIACAASAQVNTTIYNAYDSNGNQLYTDTGSGVTWTGPALYTIQTPDIQFGTDNGWYWAANGYDPNGNVVPFVADITSDILVSTAGNYNFDITSDDGSYMFIDSGLLLSNGGGHGPNTVSGSEFLSAGSHTLEVQFYEDFGGTSGVDVNLPQGVTYATPEPAPIAALGLGLLAFMRRRRK